MKLIHYSAIAIGLCLFTSCEKELSLELGDVNAAKVKEFQNFVLSKKFQLSAFYSDIPIDYNDTDAVVKQETNLWPYVSNYLKDDYTIFMDNGTDVTITQNASQMPGLAVPVLNRKYLIACDDGGVYMNFLDYQYNPLKYELHKTGPDYYILSIRWKNGVTLYSKFEVVP